jgi:hypothetical protein
MLEVGRFIVLEEAISIGKNACDVMQDLSRCSSILSYAKLVIDYRRIFYCLSGMVRNRRQKMTQNLTFIGYRGSHPEFIF